MKPDHQDIKVDAYRQRKTSSSSSSAPEAKKFRLSCDNCFVAKVKCSKERPICLRCNNSKHKCVYSPSRRVGKPRSSRGGHSGLIGASNSTSPALPLARTPPPSCSPEADPPWKFEQLETEAVPSPAAPERLAGMPLLLDMNHSNTNFFTADAGRTSYHHNGYQDLESLSQQSTLSTLLDPCFDQNTLNRSSTSPSDGVTPSFTDDNLARRVRPIPDFHRLSSSFTDDFPPLLSPDEMGCLSLPLSGRVDGFGHKYSSGCCSCSTTLHDTLSALYSPSTSFDHLLAINKSSINRVTIHLSCTCPPEISSIMLLSVIITKIMHWYKMSKDGKGMQNKALTLGSFRMDEEDEQRIKMALVKSELRKVENLLSRFRKRFDKSLSGSDKQVYEANMAFLEKRLNDTIKGL